MQSRPNKHKLEVMFETRYTLILMVLLVWIANAPPLLGQESILLLSEAIYEEEINGDLIKAIDVYNKILSLNTSDRHIIAECLLRLGNSHEKLGNEQALIFYRRLVSEFADQRSFAADAQLRLDELLLLQNSKNKPLDISILKHSKKPIINQKVLYNIPNFKGSISPNGKYFSYIYERDLGLLDRSTGLTKKLTSESHRFVGDHPYRKCDKSIWSKDSQKIAFLWDHEYNGKDLRIFDLEKNEYKNLFTPGEGRDIRLFDWSENGIDILALLIEEKEVQIIIINSENGSYKIIKILSSKSWSIHNRLVFSPDGQYIMYDHIPSSGKNDVFLLSLDGEIDKPIIAQPSNDRIAAWLKNGNEFLYISDLGGSDGIWKGTLSSNLEFVNTELILDGLGDLHSESVVGLTNEGIFYYLTKVNISHLYHSDIDIDSGLQGPEKLIFTDDLTGRIRPTWSSTGDSLAYLRLSKHPSISNKIELKDMNTGKEHVISPGRSDWGDLGVCWPEWTGRQSELLLTYNSKDPPRRWCVLFNTETAQIDPIVDQCHWQKLGKDDKMYYSTNQNIIERDLKTDEEKIIYKTTDNIRSLSVSPDGRTIAFFSSHADNNDFRKLKLLHLGDLSVNTVFSCQHNEQFSPGSPPEWLNDGQRLLISFSDDLMTYQQLYIFNLETGDKVALGDKNLGQGIFGGMIYNIALHPKQTSLVYVKSRIDAVVWSLANF